MNLGKKFGKIKNPSNNAVNIAAGIGTFLGIAIAVYLFNLLWNYASPVWGLPKLSYLECLASLLVINFLKQVFGFKATKGNANPNQLDFVKILGELPNEKQ